MRQVLQSLSTGKIEVVEAPAPRVAANHVLIEARCTVISAGTERMLLEFGRGNLLSKAMQQPERVKQTLQKMQTDGIEATLTAVRSKLDQPIPLGYCSSGVVLEVGEGVTAVSPGDHVVSNAAHAEVALVPRTLIAAKPASVPHEHAAFTPLGAIALQGVRLAEPTLGETFFVMGLGLVGLMAVQILRANGCRVIGSDYSPERLAMAQAWGAQTVNLAAGEDPVAAAMTATNGLGVDGVLIAASTDSDEPVSQAARMCRKRGRVVLLGVTGLKLSRPDFYEREISFQVSCSYGPGRYDPSYEQRGVDYPYGFVRWTEQRNFEAVLELMRTGAIDVAPMISHRFPITEAAAAYDGLLAKDGSALGIVLEYPSRGEAARQTVATLRERPAGAPAKGVVAMIGAGNHGGRVLAPALRAAGARLHTIVSRGGVTAAVQGRKAGFESAATDISAALANPEIDSVVITTRHGDHARSTAAALEAGKHVFVEKPLGLTLDEVDQVEAAYDAAAGPLLMVGFNRRFAPTAVAMRKALASVSEPKCFVVTVNAGAIPATDWVHDPREGGGRIVGEACHFIDLLRFLVGAPIVDLVARTVTGETSDGIVEDKASMILSFADGSIGTIHYFANGSKTFPKERIEAFAGGRTLRIDNFRKLEAWGWPGRVAMSGKQDKGHNAAVKAFLDAVRSGGPSPIPADQIFEVARWSVRAAARPSQ